MTLIMLFIEFERLL